MPTSQYHQINQILQLITLTNPKSVLDMGVGFGKYGFLTREYLDIFYGRMQKDTEWKITLDGIEAFENYINPVHHYIYNELFIGNALEILPTLNKRYDLVLLIDVLEHFVLEEGIKILAECRKKGRNIIISVPKSWYTQNMAFGNEYETHRAHWRKEDFSILENKFFVRNKISLICYSGIESNHVSRKLSKLKLEGYRNMLVSFLEFLRIKDIIKNYRNINSEISEK